MPAKWMDYRGKTILYVDFRHLSSQEILPLMKESDDMVRASPTKVLYLGNIENAAVSREVMGQLRRYSDKTVRKKFERLAVVGVTGVKKVFLGAFVTMLDESDVQVGVGARLVSQQGVHGPAAIDIEGDAGLIKPLHDLHRVCHAHLAKFRGWHHGW